MGVRGFVRETFGNVIQKQGRCPITARKVRMGDILAKPAAALKIE